MAIIRQRREERREGRRGEERGEERRGEEKRGGKARGEEVKRQRGARLGGFKKKKRGEIKQQTDGIKRRERSTCYFKASQSMSSYVTSDLFYIPHIFTPSLLSRYLLPSTSSIAPLTPAPLDKRLHHSRLPSHMREFVCVCVWLPMQLPFSSPFPASLLQN